MVGAWGQPEQSLAIVLTKLPEVGAHVKAVSENFITRGVGGPPQANFFNLVALVRTEVSPAMLLRGLKRLERAAGRRQRVHWGPRPLDLDILDAAGAPGWSRRPKRALPRVKRRAGQLQCPHPELQKRLFVLLPLSELAPHWYHPGLRRSVRALLQAPVVKRQRIGLVRQLRGNSK
jgi:2-amino-4-hydroxy-6-hydroxymethyldihydropteridine diphosphokinase